MIISNNRNQSVSETFKYYSHLFLVLYTQVIYKLRKGDRPTQTRVFLAIGTTALIVIMVLNLFHVVDITTK
jgi:DMSO/TMAO reductase YedYZ heme-binding membrane subunit